MLSFKEFIKESVDISRKAQLKGLAGAYEHHIRQAAGAPDGDDAKHHSKEAQKYLKRISDNHGSDKALKLQKGMEIKMKHEAGEAFDR